MYEDVLVATDGSDVAANAAESAIALASTLEATVHAVSVAKRSGGRGLETCKEHARAVAREAADAGCETETVVRKGRPSSELTAYAEEADVDLIVMGTHGRTGLRQTILGSVALEVVRESRRPVLTVGPDVDSLADLEDVLLATNGWSGSEGATDHALGLAEACGASVHALYAVDVGSADEEVRESFEEHGRRTTEAVVDEATDRGLEATGTVAHGDAHEVILDHATSDETDLLVMGTESKSDIERLVVGSVSQRVVPNADVPVMTVRTLGE